MKQSLNTMTTKKCKTRNIRHILESPFNLKWFEKTVEDIAPLQEALKELLPPARLEKKQITLNFKAREENIKEKNIIGLKRKEKENVYRSYIVPGFQAVLGGLDKNELCCFIMDNNITPILLLKVLLIYGHTSNVPFTIVPGLKTISKSTLGFSTMVLGFKNLVSDSTENSFHSIFKMVSQNPTIIDTPFIVKSCKEDNSKTSTHSYTTKCINPKDKITANDVYLYRQINGNRAFIPARKRAEGQNTDLNTGKQRADNFIALCGIETSNTSSIVVEKEELHNIDSDNSEDMMHFFVDNIADESLLEKSKHTGNVINRLTPNSRHKTRPENKNTPGNIHKIDHKHQGGKKCKTKNQSINYKPLIIKSITNNLKRNKKRKRNKKLS